MHSTETPSEWVLRWAQLVERGPVLDVACGAGRHATLFAERGFEVYALDRDDQVLPGSIHFVRADLEDGSPWPLHGKRFAAIVVTNYLHRPLFPRLVESLEPGAVLIYETFMLGNERYGRPSNPNFLLRPGELLEAFATLGVVAFEQGTVERPKKAVVQRICVIREPAGSVRIPA
ncbi:MAG TPA: class I SAM-dependent methyltransferase [Burkholderiales bacterium]|jgi:SAM-dependent methyltransferase|nr:class I SAM-dependent methyltransferase [Burkholderiales bacterium]